MTLEISKSLLANALKLIASGAVGAAIFSLPIAGSPRAAIGAVTGAAAFAWVSGRSRNEFNRNYVVAYIEQSKEALRNDFSLVFDRLDQLKTDENERKLNEAFNYLFTNQGGLVTLAQLAATSGVDPNLVAAYLSEKLKLLQAKQVEPNAFVFAGHPQDAIRKIEETLIAQLQAKLQQQPQPQVAPPQPPQPSQAEIEQIILAYKQAQEAQAREAWRQQNGIPAPQNPDLGQAAVFGGL